MTFPAPLSMREHLQTPHISDSSSQISGSLVGKVSWSGDDSRGIPHRGGLSNLWPPPVECVHTAASRPSFEGEQKSVTGSKVEGEESI